MLQGLGPTSWQPWGKLWSSLDTALSLSLAPSSPASPEAGEAVESQGEGWDPPLTTLWARTTARLTDCRAGPLTAVH